MPIKVAIVEDHRRVREGFIALINGDRGFRCVGAHRTAEIALKRIPTEEPDVVLMDIRLPGISGIDCVKRLKAVVPTLLVLMLTVFDEDDLIFRALKAGADGYLLKLMPSGEILSAVAEVHAGGAPMSSGIARRVLQSFHRTLPAGSTTEALSVREREILELLSNGRMNKEIADLLSISFQTVHTHIRNIYQKLHVHSRTEAVAKYLRPS